MKEIVERANSLVVNVHMESNPHIPIDRVNSKRLLVNTKDLDKLVTEIKTLRDEIRDLDEDLGIDELNTRAKAGIMTSPFGSAPSGSTFTPGGLTRRSRRNSASRKRRSSAGGRRETGGKAGKNTSPARPRTLSG